MDSLRFTASLFNSSQPKPGWPTTTAFGEDLAEWLRARLQVEGWELTRPRWRNGAWECSCRRDEVSHRLSVRLLAGAEWCIGVDRTRSWLASLMLPGATVDAALADALRTALSREPAVQGLRWSRRAAAERALGVG